MRSVGCRAASSERASAARPPLSTADGECIVDIDQGLEERLAGIPMPDLREIDSRTAINLNARLEWSKSRFYI